MFEKALNDKPRAYICRSYFLCPQYCKYRILEDSTDNCIKVRKIALYYRENVGPRNKRVFLASAQKTVFLDLMADL